MVGITVSDRSVPLARARFESFVSSLDDAEKEQGEVKGRLLRPNHAMAFCRELKKIDGLQVTPAILDLSHLAEAGGRDLASRLRDRLQSVSTKMLHAVAQDGWELLGRQVGNLSVNQMLRIYSLANAVREALEHAILFLSSGRDRRSWTRVGLEIDRVVRSGSREERVFSVMLLAWLAGWSVSHPFTFIKEVHTPDHPIVKLYDTDQGLDIGRMLRDKIAWVDSACSWGVQMADIAASIVYQAARDLDDSSGSVARFGALMGSCPYGPGKGPGLFSPLPDQARFSGKYRFLQEAMER